MRYNFKEGDEVVAELSADLLKIRYELVLTGTGYIYVDHGSCNPREYAVGIVEIIMKNMQCIYCKFEYGDPTYIIRACFPFEGNENFSSGQWDWPGFLKPVNDTLEVPTMPPTCSCGCWKTYGRSEFTNHLHSSWCCMYSANPYNPSRLK